MGGLQCACTELLRGDSQIGSHLAHVLVHTRHHAEEIRMTELSHSARDVHNRTDPSPSGPLEPPGISCLLGDAAAMVKDKSVNRTLQYQQTLVSSGSVLV